MQTERGERRERRRGAGVAVGFGVLLLAGFGGPAAAHTYTLTNLGTLSGAVSRAYDINAAGQVVGQSYTASINHAFLFSDGIMTDIGSFGNSESYAYGINRTGQVVGWTYASGSSSYVAFLYNNGLMTDLGNLGRPQTYARRINDLGQIVGDSVTTAGQKHAFLWQNGTMQDLGTLGGTISEADDINNQGQVVGWSRTAGNQGAHAFLFTDGQMQDLGPADSRISGAYAINDAGQAVGYTYLGDTSIFHAVLFSDGQVQDLGTLGGAKSDATDINAAGEIVGYSDMPFGAGHPFLWRRGVMTDLNRLIPPGLGWEIVAANAINDAGQIVGVGVFGGQERAILLTPTLPSAPTSLVATAVSTSQVSLSWTDTSSNERGFAIWRKKDSDDYALVARVGPDTTAYTDAGVSTGNTYTYRVCATNGMGASGWTNEAAATTAPIDAAPTAPANLTAEVVSSARVNMSWTDNSDNESAFAIWRKVGPGEWTRIAVVGPNVTRYTDNSVSAGNSYTYRVRATNSAGASAWTNETDLLTP
jgi:probable HAF family extracellular repeat protein